MHIVNFPYLEETSNQNLKTNHQVLNVFSPFNYQFLIVINHVRIGYVGRMVFSRIIKSKKSFINRFMLIIVSRIFTFFIHTFFIISVRINHALDASFIAFVNGI